MERQKSEDKKISSTTDSSGRSTYAFEIGGLPYKVRSSHDSAIVNELVAYVDEKISQALVQTKSGSFQSAAVLAALNIAEELILLKKRIRKDLERLEDRTQKVSRELDKIKGSKAGHA
jgi:cell division protein ZapA